MTRDESQGIIRQLRMDRSINITGLIGIIGTIVSLVVGGTFFYSRTEQAFEDVLASQESIKVLSSDGIAMGNRLVRVETRLDTIIEQNASILSEMRKR